MEPGAPPSLSSPRSDTSSAFTVALSVMNCRRYKLWRTVYEGSQTYTQEQKIFKSVSNSDLNLWNLLCASVFINQLMYCILQFIRTCVCMQVLLYWYTVCKYTVLKAICTATKWPQVYLQPTVALWPVRMYPSIISISCSAGGLAVWGNLSTRYFQVACAPLNETEVNMCVCPDCSQEIIYTTTS